MDIQDDGLEALERVVAERPADAPLKELLATLLLARGHAARAAERYREVLRAAPGRGSATLGLARALEATGDHASALSVLDAHFQVGDPPPDARLAYARLLLAADRRERAVEQYRTAVGADPALADPFLAKRLGVEAAPAAAAVTPGGLSVVPRAASAAPAGSEPPAKGELERPKVTFRDVGGMDALKEEIRLKIIHPLEHPELFEAYGKKVGGGILLYGPPGCGKTHVARATAGEVRAHFLSVGITDVLDMWLGSSEQRLHELFEEARQHAPCVLFFDEVDALGASRADMRANAGRHLINQFLAELDGFDHSNDGVLVLAATNAPWHLDPAFRRPGRFDRVIFVPPPDAVARARVVEILMSGRPSDGIDAGKVAKKTDGFSGADLKAMVDLAVESRLADAMRTGTRQPVATKHLLEAAARVKPSTREWLSTARNYVLYANQSGLYDEVRAYLGLT